MKCLLEEIFDMSLLLTVLAALFATCTGCYQSEFIKVVELTYPPGSTDAPIREWATDVRKKTKTNLFLFKDNFEPGMVGAQ